MNKLLYNFKHLLLNDRFVYLAGPEGPTEEAPKIETEESVPSDFSVASEQTTIEAQDKGRLATEQAIQNLTELTENSDIDVDPKKALETAEESAFNSKINQLDTSIDSAISNNKASILIESIFSLQVLVEGNVQYLTNEEYDDKRVAINRTMNKIQSGMRTLRVENFDTDFTVYRNRLNDYAEAADKYNKADESLSAYQLNNNEIDNNKLAELQDAANLAEANWNKAFDNLKSEEENIYKYRS